MTHHAHTPRICYTSFDTLTPCQPHVIIMNEQVQNGRNRNGETTERSRMDVHSTHPLSSDVCLCITQVWQEKARGVPGETRNAHTRKGASQDCRSTKIAGLSQHLMVVEVLPNDWTRKGSTSLFRYAISMIPCLAMSVKGKRGDGRDSTMMDILTQAWECGSVEVVAW